MNLSRSSLKLQRIMDLFSSSWIVALVFFHILPFVNCVTFTFINNCGYTVWPGILSNAGSPRLETTGFALPQGHSLSFQAPTGWSGRFWGRTGCDFDNSGRGVCVTGDCGSGQIECNGAGASPPATLAEFTLSGAGGKDFYDVSLVDGYNLPMIVEINGGSGTCGSTGCLNDLNRFCPVELRFGNGDACRSACEAFGKPEFCCSGEYATPDTCRPSVYSQMFKSACPRSYSYAYDDATSTFTCTGADYSITFCPGTTSQKSSTDPTSLPSPEIISSSTTATTTTTSAVGGAVTGTTSTISTPVQSEATPEVFLGDSSLLANLAMSEATHRHSFISVPKAALVTAILLLAHTVTFCCSL